MQTWKLNHHNATTNELRTCELTNGGWRPEGYIILSCDLQLFLNQACMDFNRACLVS